MKHRDVGFPYWSIDVPGLDENDAKELVQLAGKRSGVGGFVVDPHHLLTWHMDRATVEILADVLRRCGDESTQTMLEEMTKWLSRG